MNKLFVIILAAFSTLLGPRQAHSEVYTIGQVVPIKANFNQDLGPSTMTVRLNNQQVIVLNQVNGKSLGGSYTIGANQNIPDLAIEEILSANITNLNGGIETNYKLPSSPGNLIAENSEITRNLGDSSNIMIGNFRAIPVGANPYGISAPVVINGRTYIYVACQGAAIVQKIDTYIEQVVETYNVGQEPYGLKAVNVAGVMYIYVANTGSDTVSAINTINGNITTIPVGVKPYYVTSTATKVYVSNSLTNDVSVIDTLTQSVVASPFVGTYPRGVALHQFDIYIANYGDLNYGGGNSVSVISTSTNTNTATIPLPLGHIGPRGITLARNHYLFVTNYLSNNVSLVNPHVNKVFPTPEDGQINVPSGINVGKGPRGIIAVDSLNKVYVENFDEGTLSIINSETFSEINRVKVGHSPSGMSIVGNKLYISSFQDNALYVLDVSTDKLKVPIITEGKIQYEFFDDFYSQKVQRATMFTDSGDIGAVITFDTNGNALKLTADNGVSIHISSIKINEIQIGNAQISFGILTPEEQRFYSPNYSPLPAPQPVVEVPINTPTPTVNPIVKTKSQIYKDKIRRLADKFKRK